MDGGNLIHTNVVAAAALNNEFPEVLEYILNHPILEKDALEARTTEEYTKCLIN